MQTIALYVVSAVLCCVLFFLLVLQKCKVDVNFTAPYFSAPSRFAMDVEQELGKVIPTLLPLINHGSLETPCVSIGWPFQ